MTSLAAHESLVPLLSSLFVLQLQTHKIVTRQTPVLYHDGDITRVCLLEQERQHETQTPRSVADAHRAWTGFFQRLWSSLLTCRRAQSKGNTAYPLAWLQQNVDHVCWQRPVQCGN